MLTTFDKALVPIIAAVITWINQRYGYHFDTDPANLTIMVGAVASIITFFIPNKAT